MRRAHGFGRAVRLLGRVAPSLGWILVLAACTTAEPTVPTPTGSPSATPTAAVSREVSVADFGARGDGRADDRPAFQAALDEAARVGGELVVPPGVFRLASQTIPGDRVLRTYPDQHIQGAGRDRTVLAVAGGIGDYVAVIGAASDPVGVGTWSLTGLTVHQGASAGGALDVDRQERAPRMVLRLGDYGPGGRVTVTDCAFTDTDNLNTLYLFAPRLTVSRNEFRRVGGPVGTDVHDHSSLYLTTTAAGTIAVTRNVFTGVRGSGGARTAIETHGGRQVITDNTVTDYLRGLNVTGVAVPATPHVLVRGNTLSGVAIGAQLWAEAPVGGASGPVLGAVELVANVIDLDAAVWSALPGLSFPTAAVLVNPDNTATIDDLEVRDNAVRFRSGASPAAAHYSAAVSCGAPAVPTPVRRLVVTGNHVVDAPRWLTSACDAAPSRTDRGNTVR